MIRSGAFDREGCWCGCRGRAPHRQPFDYARGMFQRIQDIRSASSSVTGS